MDVKIQGTNVTITSTMEEFTKQKLEKLYRYLPNIQSVRVDFTQNNSSRSRDIMVVQITLRHSRGAILRAEERVEISDGVNAAKIAVINAIDKMYSRIRRFKGKTQNKRLRERFTATLEEIELAETLPDELDADLEYAPAADQLEPQIIRRKNVAVSAMNEEEAIQQMELLGHTFFMFFNMDDNKISVVYKRSNGGYGLLIPQVE